MLRTLLSIPLLLGSGSISARPDFSSVRAYLDDSVSEGTVAGGSLMVLQKGDVVLECGFGYADLETKKSFEVDTPAIIASISKPVIGTALHRLIEADELEARSPISKYLPEFANLKLTSGAPLRRTPNIVELLTHTSGIRNDESAGGHPWFAPWTQGKTLSYVVKKYAQDFDFLAQPGTRYAYSGIGTDVAARVAEVVSKKPRNELLAEAVCKPLGMKSTYYWDAVQVENRPAMPTRYFRGNGGKLLESRRRYLPEPNHYSSSGGTIISTAPDLSRWLLMIRNQGVHEGRPYLMPETVGEMLSGTKVGRNAQGGFFIRKKTDEGEAAVVGHSGSSGTDCWIDFRTDVIAILLTQTRGVDIDTFRFELRRRIGAATGSAER